jgi:hypothetical protein
MKGGEQEWQTYAALGLVGKTGEALEGLARFDHPEAAFYSAVARWIGGEDDRVAGLLEPINTPHAQNLLALLRKPRIEVLAQWPWTRDGCSDLLTGSAADARFRVTNIGFHADDLPNKPYADVHDYFDPRQPPDFYVCAMVEWHPVPPNLPELPCPVFGQTGDYDLHIQTVYPWLGLFDAVLVTDPSEWIDVRRLVCAPVYTFPKAFGLPDGLPPPRPGEREVDLYLSGTILHPYHPDKAQLLHQILQVSDLRLEIVNGFHVPARHYDNLSRSKVCVSYVRHSTAMPTRGLEALAMGCALVVQEDSVLTLFAGPEQGVLTYDLGRNDLPAAVREIVGHWPDFARRAEAGARLLREEFALSRVASQYLRFLTFLAARPRAPRPPRSGMGLCQKRCVLQKGWLPSIDYCHGPPLRAIAVENERHLQAVLATGPTSPHALIDLAREAVLANYHRARAGLIPVPEWLAYLSGVYRGALERFPGSLVARFNYLRVVLHFGTPEAVSEILPLLDETLGLPPGHWQIDVMEDVFPWDFFPQFFNYRGYFDRVTAHLAHGTSVEADLARLILASLHAYRGFYPSQHGFYSPSLDDYQAAAALDPDFPYFKLWYARQLLQRGLADDRLTAERLLRELARTSLVFLEAYGVLLTSHRQGLKHRQQELNRLVARGDSARAAQLRREIDRRRAAWKQDELTRHIARVRQVLEVLESVAVPALRPDLRQAERKRALAPPVPQEVLQMLCSLQGHVDQLHDTIRGMESSKFWKVRTAWVALKRCLGLGAG